MNKPRRSTRSKPKGQYGERTAKQKVAFLKLSRNLREKIKAS